ncbi:alkane 1-monooxygenase [Gemmobacter denitrificans]|uniref:Alkane 1-monooxygenase n=1 Tax=Gemmobacter denitrificans TaxID=3123040 RepID=A0ABU8BX99_9RHOB
MPAEFASLRAALPFWLSVGLLPLALLAITQGGWWVILIPAYAWALTSLLDVLLGHDTHNPDPETEDEDLFWYRAITLIWLPLQALVIYGGIWWASRAGYSWPELLGLFFGIGVMSGSIGIVYAHELMHQADRMERWLADLLLALVLYSHFRSEHLLVHHTHVGTPRDAVTARYNEGFHRFFLRVLRSCPASAWQAETARQNRAGRSVWHLSNPFWRYTALQALALVLAYAIGGWLGVFLFAFQAFVAIWQLELTNYIEHYGLTRERLANGKFEPVRPHHSWNAPHRASNWLLINLQRHSDHHYKPDRRFPLLQTYGEDEAPLLPIGYPALGVLAMVPPLWRRRMNPRVRAWRKRHYPAISDWMPYNIGQH